MSKEDLWGDIPIEKEVKLPITILKEQATVLGEKTNKILEAKVTVVDTSSKKNSVGYTFDIIAPALSNFRFSILQVYYSAISVYPVRIFYENSDGQRVEAECNEEVEFVNQLREVLSSKKVHTAISSLLAQSKATV